MSGLLANLNKEQLSAVKHAQGPLLIVAGAGTGKTTVITRRIAHLIEQKLAEPEEILALTFTDKAAAEMQERLDLLLPIGYFDSWISTFHSFCQRILQQHGLDIGLSNDFKLLDQIAQWILVHENFEKFSLEYYRPLGNPARFISALLKHFSKCKDELISPENYLEYSVSLRLSLDNPEKAKKKKKIIEKASADQPDETEIARIEEIAQAYHVYQKLLLDNNFLDFGDLINYALALFEQRPNILKAYQQKFKFAMVDEFQDTNYSQYQLVKLLAGQSKNLVVVGDDDQSIYKFRGASVSNILKFKQDFPSLKEISLIENYRSSQNILDLAYRFIQANNPDRLEIKLGISKELKSNTQKPGQIEVLEGKDLSEELDLVAKKIVSLKNQKAEVSWNDFAILIRRNAAADELLPVLASYAIPNIYLANTGLYKKKIIADLVAYLKVLENFHDSLALYRVLGFEEFRIPAQDLATLIENSAKRTLSLYETLIQASFLPELGLGQETSLRLEHALSVIRSHAKQAQGKAVNELFVEIVADLKLGQYLKKETLESAEDRDLVEQFYKKLEAFVQENADKSLHHFMHRLNLETEAGDEGNIKFDPNIGPEAVKILTVHMAKGLEFEYVFIINLVDKQFPSIARSDGIQVPDALIKDILPEGDAHIGEERRLFYVALTRAKSQLFLTWAKDYGGKTLKKPSQFLRETNLVPSDKISQATGRVVFSKPKKHDVVFQKLPDTFSFSDLRAFEKCPLEYKYKHYLKLPSPGSASLSFGNTIHKVFELYLKDYQNRLTASQPDLFGSSGQVALPGNLEFLEDLYKKNWVDEWYKDKKQKEEYRKAGIKIIKTFHTELLKNQAKPKYIEQSFFLFLDKYKLKGRIDRADYAEAGIAIIDYKTGEKIPKKNEKNDLDQLYVYQWAAQEYLKESVVSLSYWYINQNTFLKEEVAGANKITELKARLLEVIEKIIYTTKHDLFKQEHEKTPEHLCQYLGLE